MNGQYEPRANPFPGLRPFRSDEHHLFFGREEQTAALLQLLRQNRFLAVVGTSGSGKSSLVRAGLIAALHGGTMTHAGSHWEVVILRPGGSPIENVARALVEADLYDPGDPSTLPRLLATLNRSRFGLVEAVKQSDVFEPGTNLLVVVDQFEELFRFRQQGISSEEVAASFVNLLLTASQQEECPVYVAITMRSDYLGDCSEIPGLAEAVNDGEYLIPRLLRDQKRDAIEKPIGVGGAKISPLLVQRLLNDVGDDPDQLPVLQHALMRMWDVWEADDYRERPIDFCDFEAIGGLEAALSNHADEIFESLPDDAHRTACERIFKTLTEKGADNRGIRRPTRLARLETIAGADRATVTTVLDAFRKPGVTFLMPGLDRDLDDRTVLDLSHESLMRVWRRLRSWVEDEAQSARIFRRLLDTAWLWKDGKAGLFRDPDLQIALSWREEEQPNSEWAEQYGGQFETAIAFLNKSEADNQAEIRAKEAARQRELEQAQQLAEARKERLEHQQRAAKRLRAILAGLAVVAAIACVACVAAMILYNKADGLAVVAQKEANDANAEREKVKQEQTKTKDALKDLGIEKTKVDGLLKKSQADELKAVKAEQRSREFRYATDIQLAGRLIGEKDASATQVFNQLAAHDPAKNPDLQKNDDLRGFEAHYLARLVDSRALVFPAENEIVTAVVVTPEGELVTLDDKAKLRRRDVKTREETRPVLDLGLDRKLSAMALSPDGKLVALAIDNQVLLLDTETGAETRSPIRIQAPYGLLFTPDGKRLVTIGTNIGWWDLATGKPIALQESEIRSVVPTVGMPLVSISADGNTVAVGGLSTEFRSSAFSVFRLNEEAREVQLVLSDYTANMGSIRMVRLSPDGTKLAASQFFSGKLVIFDTADGKQLEENQTEHAASISAIAFNPGGTAMLTASLDGVVKVWNDYETLTTADHSFMGHTGQVSLAAFVPGGKQFITSSSTDNSTRLWNLEQQEAPLRRTISGSGYRVAFSPDGLLLATSGQFRNQIRICDAATGEVVRNLVRRGSATTGVQPYSVAFSPDNRRLAVGYGGAADQSYIELWDIDGDEVQTPIILEAATAIPGFNVSAVTGIVSALSFSPDGKHLIAGFGSLNSLPSGDRDDFPIQVIDVAARRTVRILQGHKNYCVSVAFSQDGTRMASASYDSTVRIWDTATWKTLRALDNPDENSDLGNRRMFDAAFSPDGKLLATASHEGNVHVWDLETGDLKTLRGHANGVQAVTFSPDGKTLASGSEDSTVRLWHVATWRELLKLDSGDSNNGFKGLAFSPDGRILAAAGGRIFTWATLPPEGRTPDQLAAQLAIMLKSKVDFQSRIRMLSDNLRLHEALAIVAKQQPDDVRVQSALVAARAHWHASREEWQAAVEELDKLKQRDPDHYADWLRTPVRMLLARACLEADRPADTIRLLADGPRQRELDGLSRVREFDSPGFTFRVQDGTVTVLNILKSFQAAPVPLSAGDVLLKIGDLTPTEKTTFSDVYKLMRIDAGKTVRLTVRRAGSGSMEEIELSPNKFLYDPNTAELLILLKATLDDRIANAPADLALREARAELAQQWQGNEDALADYTAVIDALAAQPGDETAPVLSRLYAGRGRIYSALQKWQQAAADFAHCITEKNTDENLLRSQAEVQGTLLLEPAWTVLEPVEMKSEGGAMLTLGEDNSIFVEGDRQVKDVFILEFQNVPADIRAIRLEALRDDRLPNGGPGTHSSGNFVLSEFKAFLLNGADSVEVTPLSFRSATATYEERPAQDSLQPTENGWSISPGGVGRDQTAYFAVDPPVAGSGSGRLRIQLKFAHVPAMNIPAVLGRFRLSVTDDPTTYEKNEKLIAALKKQKLTGDPWQTLAAGYRSVDDQAAIDELVARHPQSAGVVGDLFVEVADGEEKNWQRAIEIYSKGVNAGSPDPDLLAKRARAYEELQNWEAAAADWQQVAKLKPDGAEQLAEFANRLELADQRPAAQTQRNQARQFYEAVLQADPANDLAAVKLSELLSAKSSTPWTVISPDELKAEGGEILTVEDDHSVFVSGPNPDRAIYTLKLKSPVQKVTALRLETIPDSRLPSGGAGRNSGAGNFHVSEVTAALLTPDGQTKPLKFSTATANFHMGNYLPSNIIDGNVETMWDTFTHQMSRNFVSLALSEPVEPGDGMLQLTIDSGIQRWKQHGLGRFRLSVTDDPELSRKETLRDMLTKLEHPAAKLAAGYLQLGETDRAVAWAERALDAADNLQEKQPLLELIASDEKLADAIQKQRPQDPFLQIAAARSRIVAGQQKLKDKKTGEALTELQHAQKLFSQLLDEHPAPAWTVLQPTEMISAGGATLTLKDDGSILASGENPDRDDYTIVAPAGLDRITAFRLEVLPDPSLPRQGPGRFDDSAFHLNELRITAGGVPVKLTGIAVSYDEKNQFNRLIDGLVNPAMGWSTAPQPGQAHSAWIASDFSGAPDAMLKFELYFSRTEWKQRNLGRFRLSATGDRNAVAVAQLRDSVKPVELAALDVALGTAFAQLDEPTDAAVAWGRALDRLEKDEERKPLIAQFQEHPEALVLLAEQRPQDVSVQVALAGSLAARGKRALAEKRQTEALTDLGRAQQIFARLLAEHPQPEWTVLKPEEMTSNAGATLTRQEDGSILVSGENADVDTYTITAPVTDGNLAGLRLEMIPDDRLPGRGSGRYELSGEFLLSDIRVSLTNPADDSVTPLDIERGFASFALDSTPLSNTFDSYLWTYWSVRPRFADPHSAVFVFRAQSGLVEAGRPLKIVIKSGTFALPRRNLGRFRFSVTSDPAVIAATQLQLQIQSSGLADLDVALAGAHAHQEQWAQAVAGFGRALDLAVDRAAVEKIVATASSYEGLLDKLAAARPNDARLWGALTRHFAAQRDHSRAQELMAKARALYEQQLAAEPGQSSLAQELADLLFDVSPVDWHILEPIQEKWTSAGGAELILHADGSILASGKNTLGDAYRLVFKTEASRMTSLRFEALTDPSLPNNGPGRAAERDPGNFFMTHWQIRALREGTAGTPVKLSQAVADYHVQHIPIDPTKWNVGGGGSRPHTAYFLADPPVELDPQTRLEFFMQFFDDPDWPLQNLRRFRLAVSDDPRAFELEEFRLHAANLTNPWLRLGMAYRSFGEDDLAQSAFAQALNSADDGPAKAAVARDAAALPDLIVALLKQDPDDKWLRLGQAKAQAPLYIAKQQFQAAADLLSSVIADFPNDAELWNLQADANRGLKNWQAAVDDYAHVVELETDESRKRNAEIARAEALLRLGRTEEGADVLTEKMLLMTGDWDRMREASAAALLARNPGVARVAANRLYRRLENNQDLNPFWSGLLVRLHTAQPGLVTPQNRQRLLDAAAKADPEWTAPLTASIHYRLGELEQAQPLLTAPQRNREFQSLAAMLLYDQGEAARAKDMLKQAADWFRQQHEIDPDSAIPSQVEWDNWAINWAVWREAARKLIGPPLVELDALLEKDPDNIEALQERAKLLADADLTDEAMPDLTRLAELNVDTDETAGLRGRVLSALKRYDEALVPLNRAVELGSTDARVYAARGPILLRQGQTEPARSDLQKSIDLEPTSQAARALSDLLLAEAAKTITWTVLKPESAKSELGATFSLLDDGTTLAGGPNPLKDRYHVKLTLPTDISMTAIRLEALTHPSLPGNGPGRSTNPNGAFAQISWKVTATPPGGGGDIDVEFDDAVADHELKEYPITPGGHWAIGSQNGGHDCTAYWLLSKPISLPAGTTLTFEMQCHDNSPTGDNLGHFRLSVSDNPKAFPFEEKRLAAWKMTNPASRLAEMYQLLGREAELEEIINLHPEMLRDIGEGYFESEDWEQAIAYFDRVITPETTDRNLLANRAEAFGKLGQWDKAKADWQRVLGLKPDDDAIQQRWLAALTAGEQWDDVARAFSQQIDALPEEPQSYAPRAQLIRKIIRRNDPVFERLLALRPDDAALRINLARNFVTRSDWENAVKEYAKVIDSIPPSEQCYEYAATLLLAGKRTEYEQFMKRFIERARGAEDAYLAFSLARAAGISSTPVVPPQQIVAWGEKAVSDDAERGWYLHVAGLAHLRAGDFDKSRQRLEQSVATNWHPELNQLALALNSIKQKDFVKAQQSFLQAEQWFKDHEENRKDGYFDVQDTDWLEAQLLLQEVKIWLDQDGSR